VSDLESRLSALRALPVFATVSDHNQLLAAIRRRVDELEINLATLEDIAGLQPNYATKVLGDPPPKRACPFTTFLMLQALGLDVQLVENRQAMERLRPRYAKRKLKRKIRTAMRMVELPPDFYKRISGLAADARRRKISPERRSELARVAAEARWRRRREESSEPLLKERLPGPE
jgi:hypothetical protein